MRVALFITCFNDSLFPEVGKATVTVLERLGVRVEFPAGQTCCGQMHFNSGYRAECVPLVANFAGVFAGYDAVVTPSASCASMIRHYHPVVAADTSPPPVYELCEFLTDVLRVEDVGGYFPHRVAFHRTCHSQRLLHIGDRPQRLLSHVSGLDLVELAHPESCCGFGGTFSVKNPDTSAAMGADKTADVHATGAAYLTAADTSCLMHIGGLLSRQQPLVRTVHLAQILAGTP